MKLPLAAGGALLLVLLTWLLLGGVNTNASAYAETERALDDFALAEASISRDVLQARAGLLGNYDVLVDAENAMESAVGRIRVHAQAENLDLKPLGRLAAAVEGYEELIERFKSGNSLLQNSLSYVGVLSTDPSFGALGDQFASSATALAAAVLHLASDSSAESARSLQQQIDRFEAQAPTGGPDGEAAHALLAHARLLSELLPQVEQTLRALVASPTRQPFEETRELLVRAQAAFEVTAQRSRVLLYVVALGLLGIALPLGQRLWMRTLKIRRLVDANIIGIFVWDFDGRILEANEAFLQMVSYDHEDLAAGRIRWTDLTPPEWRDRDTQLIQEHKAAGFLPPFEKEYFRKDGSRVPVLIGVATYEKGGNQGVAFVLDLTERKRAEEALRRSQANLAEAQRLSHTGSWALSPATTKILYWSEECYRIWGFDPAHGLPDRASVFQRIHPDDRDSVLDEAEAALRQKRDYTIEFRIALPDGTVKYLEAISHHVFSEEGELIQVVGTNVDLTERKRAEQALRESERKLRQFFESVPCHFWSANPDRQPTYVNQRLLDYFGIRFEDQNSRDWQATLHPDDVPETERALDHAFQTGESFQRVHRLRRADGEYRWHRVRAEPLRDRQGHIIQWYGFSIDIDEGKKAEDQLRRSEAYLAEAQRISHTGSWALSPATTKILYWSDECYRIWGFDPAQGLPNRETIWRRVHPEDRKVLDEAEEALRQKRDYTIDFRIVLPDGTLKYLEATVHHLFSEHGELIEVVGTNVDVTERKKAEDQLRRSESYLAEAQRLSHTGTCVFDATTMLYLYWSDECYRIWGLDPLQGLPSHETMWQRIHPDDRDGVWEGVQEALRQNRDYTGEFRIVLPDGTVKYLAASMQHMFSADGEIAEVIGTHIDVTERKRAQEEHERLRQLETDLAHMNRLGIVGEQAASLAHEITQPIASSRNNARAALNFLDRQPADLGNVREALACVVGNADRAGEIIDRIRDQIRKAPPRKDRFDLNHAIDEVIVLGRYAITKNGVSVQARLSEGLLPVHGDRVQLQQVILNLVLNAVEAMGSVEAGPRELVISTEQTEGSGVLVTVRDSGPGIDCAHLERVFEAFYTTKTSGVGMGLSICRSIIDAHGGRLWAEANEPRGAVFQFTLPGTENELTI
jgi:PAS domain S-box-containing protein